MKYKVFTPEAYNLPYIAQFPYIDLRAQPTRIDELPELRHEPRLRPLVHILNFPQGMFMTHGCAVASRPPGIVGSTPIPIPEDAKPVPHWYSSYVIFSFYHLERNKPDYYDVIFASYPDQSTQSSVCFEIEPAYFCTPHEQKLGLKYGDTNGAICGIWATGWGTTAIMAQNSWGRRIEDLAQFFAAPPEVVRNLPPLTGTPLSQHMFAPPR
jgi:hypothetical protein